eukprot:m.9462 g.9462  ORF g.9462 m.9462 type:complete len:59 (+) comp21369_c0_seq1:803-979(+)
MFNCICKLYQPSLKRDPDYEYVRLKISYNLWSSVLVSSSYAELVAIILGFQVLKRQMA